MRHCLHTKKRQFYAFTSRGISAQPSQNTSQHLDLLEALTLKLSLVRALLHILYILCSDILFSYWLIQPAGLISSRTQATQFSNWYPQSTTHQLGHTTFNVEQCVLLIQNLRSPLPACKQLLCFFTNILQICTTLPILPLRQIFRRSGRRAGRPGARRGAWHAWKSGGIGCHRCPWAPPWWPPGGPPGCDPSAPRACSSASNKLSDSPFLLLFILSAHISCQQQGASADKVHSKAV